MKNDLDDLNNSEIEALIDERLHSERDRAIMKRRLIDGRLFKELEDEFHLSRRHCQRIVSACMIKVFKKR